MMDTWHISQGQIIIEICTLLAQIALDADFPIVLQYALSKIVSNAARICL